MALFRSILLGLFLLLAQQGGYLHALSHGFSEAHSKKENSNKSNTCEQCINYASVGSALHNANLTLVPLPANKSDYIKYNQYIKESSQPFPSARDPPSFLL